MAAPRARINLPASRESAEIADQDYVAVLIAFGEQQLLAVAGPGEIENTDGGKVRDLPRRSAGERLFPDIGCPVPGEQILKRFPGWRPV
jgi:hypothetical protein